MFETAISAFVDEFPEFLQNRKVAFTGLMCLLLFVLGLPCVTEGGMYVLQLMDWYSATFSLMIISLFELITICWIYGADRFMQDISLMINRVPCAIWKYCWCYVTPGAIISLLVFIMINHSPVSYGEYTYPQWSVVVGWFIAMCSLIPIPLCAAIQLYKAKGTFMQRLVHCLRPSPEWGPALEENRLLYKKSLSLVSSRFRQTHVAGMVSSSSQKSAISTEVENTPTEPSDVMPLQSESVV